METDIYKKKSIEIYCYTLKMLNGKFYVGITRDIENRINSHSIGAGSKFTKENLPLLFCCFEKRTFNDFTEVYLYESEMTFRLMEKYGVESVSGGTYQGTHIERQGKFNNRVAREKIRYEITKTLFSEK